ncbi:MAG TPA: hypothetical protein VE782_03645, partial [Myxococcaceae bacterium]|nr:hypothetical protein [Myxococcaceae bacterium]
AIRLGRRGEVLVSCPPSAIDGAAEELRRQGRPVAGIFSGRLGAEGEVISPSGERCAFYEATLREAGERDESSAIVARQRASGSLLWIRGERAHAALAFSPSQVFAAEEVRRPIASGRRPVEQEPTEVVSHERAGRIGESCFALGRLEWGEAPGSVIIRGIGGGAAAILIGVSHVRVGRGWMVRAWGYYAGAVALTCAAGWMLGR